MQPSRVSKQAAMIQMSVERADRDVQQASDLRKRLQSEVQGAEDALDDIRTRLEEAEQAASLAQQRLQQAEKKSSQHKATLQKTQDAADDLLGQKAVLESRYRQLVNDIKVANEQFARKTRDKEMILKALKQSEVREKVAKEGLETEAKQLASLRQAVDAKKKEALDFVSIIDKAESDFQAAQRSWEASSGLSKQALVLVHDASTRAKQKDAELQRAATHQGELERKVRALHRAMDAAVQERMRASQALVDAQEALLSRKTALKDGMRTYEQMSRNLRNVDAVYNTVKTEKNSYLAQISGVNQRNAEMRDKERILHTEIEVRGRALALCVLLSLCG